MKTKMIIFFSIIFIIACNRKINTESTNAKDTYDNTFPSLEKVKENYHISKLRLDTMDTKVKLLERGELKISFSDYTKKIQIKPTDYFDLYMKDYQEMKQFEFKNYSNEDKEQYYSADYHQYFDGYLIYNTNISIGYNKIPQNKLGRMTVAMLHDAPQKKKGKIEEFEVYKKEFIQELNKMNLYPDTLAFFSEMPLAYRNIEQMFQSVDNSKPPKDNTYLYNPKSYRLCYPVKIVKYDTTKINYVAYSAFAYFDVINKVIVGFQPN